MASLVRELGRLQGVADVALRGHSRERFHGGDLDPGDRYLELDEGRREHEPVEALVALLRAPRRDEPSHAVAEQEDTAVRVLGADSGRKGQRVVDVVVEAGDVATAAR